MARILALVSICFALAGCELVADFDRGKIPPADAGGHADKPAPQKDSGAAEEDAGSDDDAGK